MRPGFTETVAVIRPTVDDGDYDETPVYDGVTPTPVPFMVAVQPISSAELVAGSNPGEEITSGWKLLTPTGYDIDLLATDRIRWRGNDYDVQGDVWRWPHPTRPGGVHHAEVYLQRTV